MIPTRILVFARAPRPGQVKTRLIPVLGEVGAALLYEELLAQTLATCWRSEVGEVEVWLASRDAYRHLAEVGPQGGVRMAVQCVGDLGARMDHALTATLEDGALPILVGSDLPSLSKAHLEQAAAALVDGAEVVCAPAEDGGYGLIAASRPVPELFRDMAWSTETVMEETRERARSAGLDLREIDGLWDVDEPADLERLEDLEPYAELLTQLRTERA